MAAWSARPWSRSRSSASKMRGSAVEMASVPITSPPGARSGAAAIPRNRRRLASASSSVAVRDPLVGHVVEGPDRLALFGGEAVDARPEPELLAHQPLARRVVGRPGHHDGDQVRAGGAHPGQVRPVGGEQALGVLDHALEDLVGVGQGRDPRRDVAQRPFRLGPALEGHPGALQLLDEPRVGDGDGGLFGEAAQHRGVEVVEGVGPAAHDLDRAQRARVADDRRHDEVADPGRLDQRIDQVVVLEVALEVVADVDDAALGDGLARHALAQAQVRHPEGLALLVGDAGVVGPLERAGLGVVLVDEGAVGAQEALRLVDHVLQDLVRLAQGRDPRRDLAQGGLGFGPALDVLARASELLHEVRVRDRDRGVRGQRPQELDLGLGVGAGLARHDRQHAEGILAFPGEWRRDHGADAGLADEGLDLGGRLEPLVGEEVLGHDRALLGEGEAGDRLARLEAAGAAPLGDLGHGLAGRVGPAQRPETLVPQVDPRAVGPEQPGRFRHDLGQDGGRVEDGRDPGRDLAQRPFGVGPLGVLLARPLELADQRHVRDRDRRLVGQAREHRGVLLVEGVAPVGVDRDGAEDLAALEHRAPR